MKGTVFCPILGNSFLIFNSLIRLTSLKLIADLKLLTDKYKNAWKLYLCLISTLKTWS